MLSITRLLLFIVTLLFVGSILSVCFSNDLKTFDVKVTDDKPVISTPLQEFLSSPQESMQLTVTDITPDVTSSISSIYLTTVIPTSTIDVTVTTKPEWDVSTYTPSDIYSLDDKDDKFILGYGQLKQGDPMSYIYYEKDAYGTKVLKQIDASKIVIKKDTNIPKLVTVIAKYNLMSSAPGCGGDWVYEGKNICANKNPSYELHIPIDTIIRTYDLKPIIR